MKERYALSHATLDRISALLASEFDFDDTLPDPETFGETKCTIFRLASGRQSPFETGDLSLQGAVMVPVSFIKERLVILGKTITVWRELNCA